MRLFNSYSGQVEEFRTLKPKEVKMYVCGITPYDTTHLGHAFVYVTFDTLKRFLEFKGYTVTYTQNVTDIDDDLLKRAKSENRNWEELGHFWTLKFLNDLKLLNVKMPDFYIKATDSIPEIIEMIKVLLDKGFAYQSGGNVYFEAAKFPDYGKLSKFSREQMLPLLKERGGNPNDPNKKSPLDFILWQKSLPDEPYWESPWPARNASPSDAGGDNGRPGWHIECSAMIKKTLGDQIDIHGGGRDLIYPHHESELGQSESYSGKNPFVKYWWHSGMVSFRGEKMSKSLGNLVLVEDLLKNYSANSIRLMLLLKFYRKDWEYIPDLMEKSHAIMADLDSKFRNIESDSSNLNELLKDLEEDFNTEVTLRKLIEEANINPSQSKPGFELLGFVF